MPNKESNMSYEQHYRQLESMYHAAPINKIFPPDISIEKGQSTIVVEMKDDYFHSAGAVHGSVYFKLLDDAAFFAANSLETTYFVLTSSFNTYITRPISTGTMKAVGKVVNSTKSQFIVESIAYDERGKEIARGSGIFVRGKLPLVDAQGYQD